MQENELNKIASKHLGQGNSYAIHTNQFDSSLLVAMPRELARKDWSITGKEFVGIDVWHCHEATFLTDNGLPIAGTLKFKYSSDSEFMVESKSMKLYLNTFDMCRMGKTIKEASDNYVCQIEHDLSTVLGTGVSAHFFDSKENYMTDPAAGYVNLFSILSESELQETIFNDYTAQQKHFRLTESISSDTENVFKIKVNILRSRCRHTKQKDTGEAVIYIKTKDSVVDLISLLKEIVSLREVDEFHEFCAEKLFVELTSHKEVIECCVMLLYSRRGSLDINPIRTTSLDLIPQVMKNVQLYTQKQIGQ